VLDGRTGRFGAEAAHERLTAVAVRRVAAVTRVRDDEDPGLVHPRPERVEVLVTRRAWPENGRRGRRSHHDQARAVVEGELELRARGIDVGERDVGRGEDAVAVREAPVLLHPTVERVEHDADALGIVLHGLLVEHAQRREQPDLVDALLVHHLETGVGIAVLGADGLALPEELHR
jgi:hypothetical protein